MKDTWFLFLLIGLFMISQFAFDILQDNCIHIIENHVDKLAHAYQNLQYEIDIITEKTR